MGHPRHSEHAREEQPRRPERTEKQLRRPGRITKPGRKHGRDDVMFRAMYDQATHFIGILDLDGVVLEANQTACTLIGKEPSEVIGKPFWEAGWWAHSKTEQDKLREGIRLARCGETVRFETTHPGPDGALHHIDFSLKPARDASGKIICLIPEGLDITERKLSEEALQESTRRLQTIVSGAPIIIYSFDAQGVFVLSEGRGLEGMGLSPGEIVGRSVFDIYRDRPDILVNMRRALAGETFTAPTSVGDHTFDAYHTPLRNERGEYAGTIGVLVDTTKRTKAEAERTRLHEQLQQAMKMEAVGRLAGGIAHDFNNLLTIIMGNVELARLEQPSSMACERHLDEIAKAAGSAESLTRQLLAFSRRQVIEPRVLRLNGLVSGLQSMLTRLIGEDIALDIQLKGRGAVKIDPGQFEQVVVNLAVNARDAMPKGGKLVIETSDVVLRKMLSAHLASVGPGKFVLLCVSDTGFGMTDDVKKHIFEPFFTTKPPGRGTGLGLATIFGVVRQAGGAVEVHSEPGRGTTFKIYFPRSAEKAELRPGTEPEPEPTEPGGETLLIVEDEPGVRELALTMLERLGYTVLQAQGAHDALRIAAQHRTRIDLLMTDVVMPDMDGRTLAERLRAMHPEMQVLFTSGYTEDVVLRHGILVHDVNFIGKPYSLQSLSHKLKSVLANSAHEGRPSHA